MNKKNILVLLVLLMPLFHLSQAEEARAAGNETIYFAPHAATPIMESIQFLEKVKQELISDPDMQVMIEGHADAGEVREGEKDPGLYLQNLSRMRSEFVSNWLKSALDRPDMKNRISALAHHRPADRTRPEANRRVVLTLTPSAPAVSRLSVENEDGQGPRAHVPVPVFTFESVLENATVTHDYIIQNTGTAMLDIIKVNPG